LIRSLNLIIDFQKSIFTNPKNNNSKINLENDWKDKNLESLENDFWAAPTFNSYLVTTCHKLRKKQLKDFETEDLRIMISQNIGLKFLIPLAIKTLKENILADGDFYEGDLLKSVLTSDVDYWKTDIGNWEIICELFRKNEEILKANDTTNDIKNGWFDSFKEFEKYNG